MPDANAMQEAMRQLMEQMLPREKEGKLLRYRRLNQFVKPGQILFAGSSLMEQFPINELLLDRGLPYVVYTRGVGGFTTPEFARALDVCVLDLRPRHIFLNIGTNDMNTPDYTLEGLLARYEAILGAIRERLPQVRLTLLAYYPVCEPVLQGDPFLQHVLATRNNRAIAQANEGVRTLAGKVGAAFVDCNGPITDREGNLRREYTVEGMHLYGDGYARVLDVLEPYLAQA